MFLRTASQTRYRILRETILRWRSQHQSVIYFIRQTFLGQYAFTYSLIPALLYRINVPPYSPQLNLSVN